jgi:hypothetical protein
MTLLLHDHVVDEDCEFIPEALIIEFVTLLDHILERLSEGNDDSLIACHGLNGSLANDLD